MLHPYLIEALAACRRRELGAPAPGGQQKARRRVAKANKQAAKWSRAKLAVVAANFDSDPLPDKRPLTFDSSQPVPLRRAALRAVITWRPLGSTTAGALGPGWPKWGNPC